MKHKEEFTSILGYEGIYEISRSGEIYSLPRYCMPERMRIKPRQDKGNGSYYVMFVKDGEQKTLNVAKLVATTFHDNPNNYRWTNFKDGNPENHTSKNVYWSKSRRVRSAPLKLPKEISEIDLSVGAWSLSSEREYFQENKQAILQQLINERK